MTTINTIKQTIKDTIKGNVPAHVYTKGSMYYHMYKHMVKTTMSMPEQEGIGTTTYNGQNVGLILNDMMMLDMGMFPGAKVLQDSSTVVIIVNTPWTNAPRYIKEAILAHELGHVANGDLNDVNNPINIAKGIVHNAKRSFGSKYTTMVEIQADSVAIDAGHAQGLYDYICDLEEQGLSGKELRIRKGVLAKELEQCNAR